MDLENIDSIQPAEHKSGMKWKPLISCNKLFLILIPVVFNKRSDLFYSQNSQFTFVLVCFLNSPSRHYFPRNGLCRAGSCCEFPQFS